uniref:LysM domain-containing protein n=1 Tax=Nymphaea colorata TaxID=210225 RepID=A0A5K0XIV2_9MAGN
MKMAKSSTPPSTTWCFYMAMVAMTMASLCCLDLDCYHQIEDVRNDLRMLMHHGGHAMGHGHRCEEIYVVREGETLNTISEKCGDPFIVENNPHIQDPDDVFPGLIIKIVPNSGNCR